MQRFNIPICVVILLATASSLAGGAERFTITERETSGFVVTDRPAPPAARKPTRSRSEVILYSAAWCAPCRAARQALASTQLPFDIRIVDVTTGGQPEYVDSIPYFEWTSPRGRRFARWNGINDLVQRWELTQK